MIESFNYYMGLFMVGVFFFSCSAEAANGADATKIEEERAEGAGTPSLCTPNPSKQAVKLFNYLHEIQGKKTLSAAMANVNWNTNEAEWVYKHTGKYPAINCFDYMQLYTSPCSWIDYTNISVVEDWWKANGIVAAAWHWNVPKTQGSKDYAFYTPGKGQGQAETDFDVTKATQEGTYENKIVLADLNQIAYCLQLLQKKKIPVLWRPLHEAAGTWFWWGAKGAEAYKGLWRLMFNTFKEKGLDNLIWIWTSEGNDTDWYPGDEYVDMIGRDIYNQKEITALKFEYDRLTKAYPGKIVILSECGGVAKFSEQWNAGAKWTCFMPWYDYERTKSVTDVGFSETKHNFADREWWQDAWKQDCVLSRDELPSMK